MDRQEEVRNSQAVMIFATCFIHSFLQVFLWVVLMITKESLYYAILILFTWLMSLYIMHWTNSVPPAYYENREYFAARAIHVANHCGIDLLILLLLLDSVYSLLLIIRLSLLLPFLTVAGTVVKIQIMIALARVIYKANQFVFIDSANQRAPSEAAADSVFP